MTDRINANGRKYGVIHTISKRIGKKGYDILVVINPGHGIVTALMKISEPLLSQTGSGEFGLADQRDIFPELDARAQSKIEAYLLSLSMAIHSYSLRKNWRLEQ